MQIQVVDANGILQNVVWKSPSTPVDRSGTCDGLSKVVMDANSSRSGWLIQNKSVTGNMMFVNDLGGEADNSSPTCIALQPGETFPPPDYPVTLGEISIIGSDGDNYAAREW